MSMKPDKQIVQIFSFLLFLILICSCTDSYKPLTLPSPSLTFTQSIKSTSISANEYSASKIPTKSYTPVPPTSTLLLIPGTVSTTLVCNLSINRDNINFLHEDRIFWTGMRPDLWFQIKNKLEDKYPEFYNIHQVLYYQQLDKTVEYEDALSIINQASGAEIDYVNPIVVLVTVGESLDWKHPPDGDLYILSKSVRLTLLQHYREYDKNTNIRSKYPNINNASNYMIYAYFESDNEDIEKWCKSYLYLTGQDPSTSPFKK